MVLLSTFYQGMQVPRFHNYISNRNCKQCCRSCQGLVDVLDLFDPIPLLLQVSVLSVTCNQCCGAATFWAAPAPEVRGPGADSGSDQIGSAPGKKRKLQAALAPAPCMHSPYTKISYFEL